MRRDWLMMGRSFFLVVAAWCCLLAACAAKPTPPPVTPCAPSATVASTAAPAVAAPPPPRSEESARVPVTSADPQWGNRDAPVTLVAIEDFQCPFCSRAEATLAQLRRTYGPDKLRIVWKNNPLPFHKSARPAAEAAMTVFALGGNDAFWRFHDAAFGNQQALTASSFESWAAAAGVSVTQFRADYEAGKYSAKIDEDAAMAKAVGASGTPAFRINGVTVSGAQPIEKFTEVIDAQLAAAQALVGNGVKPADVYATLTNMNQAAQPKAPPPREEEEEDKAVWKVPVLSDDPVRGPRNAPVTLIIFADFQCPFCKRVSDTLQQLAAAYPQDVRFVWKDNPLPFHARAMPAAVLARFVYKAKGEAAFWKIHDAIFDSNPKLEDSDLESLARNAGVSWNDVRAAIDQRKFAGKIAANMDLASDVLARGTPHFFINGVRLSGAQPLDAFKKAVDEQLLKARGLVARGVPAAKLYDELMKDAKGPPPPEVKRIPLADAHCPVKGGATAKVTITVFSDFQCPFCKRVQPTLDALERDYGTKIRFVWRNLPLPFHADAPLAAQAAMEAFAQKGSVGFWKMHDELFAAQGTSDDAIKRPALEQLAQKLGLDMTRFNAALDSGVHQHKIDDDARIANEAGVNGTPAFVINGYYLAGAQPEGAFKKIINLALSGKPVVFPPAGAAAPPSPAAAPPSPAAAPSPAAPSADRIEASHILVQYAGALRAPASITRSKDEARQLARRIMTLAKGHADFGELAVTFSDEPGAASRRGALGSFTRRMMVQPFEDAAFALKVDEISDVVETDFGFHVIKRTR